MTDGWLFIDIEGIDLWTLLEKIWSIEGWAMGLFQPRDTLTWYASMRSNAVAMGISAYFPSATDDMWGHKRRVDFGLRLLTHSSDHLGWTYVWWIAVMPFWMASCVSGCYTLHAWCMMPCVSTTLATTMSVIMSLTRNAVSHVVNGQFTTYSGFAMSGNVRQCQGLVRFVKSKSVRGLRLHKGWLIQPC